MKCRVYVGHATDERREGLRVLEADSETGTFRVANVVKVENCTYLALNRDGTRLYSSASDPAWGPKGGCGGLAAWAVDGTDLRRVSTFATGRGAPCHVSLAPREDAVVFAEYSNGYGGFANLDSDGAFANLCVQVHHEGDGPNKPRQDKAHCHCAQVTPDGKYLCVVDLGIDQVKVYDFANRASGLNECAAKTIVTTPAGAGPRHIVFSRDGRFAYLLFELENWVSVYRYQDGTFTQLQQLRLIPDGFTDFSKAAAIRLSPDGRELFCTNRGHDSLAVFAVDAETGLLTRRGILSFNPDGGKLTFPWDFDFLPGGKFILVAFEKSGVVRSYAYDRAACAIRPVQALEGLYRPFALLTGRPL